MKGAEDETNTEAAENECIDEIEVVHIHANDPQLIYDCFVVKSRRLLIKKI